MSRLNLNESNSGVNFINRRAGLSQWLDKISELLDWDAIERILEPIYNSVEGRPSYPVLLMVRILLRKQWYGLSDPGVEEAVDDRLSFRKFVGLPLDMQCPDHSTIWRFRQALAKQGLDVALFEEINRQLDALGLIVRSGTLIDASIIKAAVKPPPFEKGPINPRDPDASWTKKNGESHFGYKAHVAVDEESNLIRDAELSSADLHDSQMVYEMIQGDEKAVYADKGYDSQALRDELEEKRYQAWRHV